LYEYQKTIVLKSKYLQVDETTIKGKQSVIPTIAL